MRTRLTLAVVGFMAAGLLACGSDEGTGPGDQGFGKDEGEISFAYSGTKLKGDFQARGVLTLDANGDPKLNSFAFAMQKKASAQGLPFDMTEMYGVDIRLLKVDVVTGFWTGLATGKFSAAMECGDDEPAGSLPPKCAGLMFMPGLDPMQYGDEDASIPLYLLTAGAVEVTSVSNGRVRGTFQGTAQLLDANAESEDIFVPGADLKVTNGTFNVPVRNDLDLGIGFNRIGEPRALHSWWSPAGKLFSR